MIFINDPSTADMHCVPIVRTRHKNPLSFTIATRELRGCYTHWFGGKTIACCLPAMCEACEVNVKKTWQGHLFGYRLNDDQLVLVVFTLPVKRFLVSIVRSDSGLYGQTVRFVRMGGRETGPIGCTWLGKDFDREQINMTALEKVIGRLYADNGNKQTVLLHE